MTRNRRDEAEETRRGSARGQRRKIHRRISKTSVALRIPDDAATGRDRARQPRESQTRWRRREGIRRRSVGARRRLRSALVVEERHSFGFHIIKSTATSDMMKRVHARTKISRSTSGALQDRGQRRRPRYNRPHPAIDDRLEEIQPNPHPARGRHRRSLRAPRAQKHAPVTAVRRQHRRSATPRSAGPSCNDRRARGTSKDVDRSFLLLSHRCQRNEASRTDVVHAFAKAEERVQLVVRADTRMFRSPRTTKA